MIKIETIIKLSANHYGVTTQELTQQSFTKGAKRQEVATARDCAMKLVRENSNLTLKGVGSCFANRDHTTVKCGIQRIQDLIDTDKNFKEYYLKLEGQVKNLVGEDPIKGKYVWEQKSANPEII